MAKQRRQSLDEDQAELSGAPLKILGAVTCFGFAVLLIYLAVASPMEATAMGAIRNVMRGIGGSINPLLALMLAWIGVLLVFSARGKRVRPLNVILNSILFLCVFTAVQLFTVRIFLEDQSLQLHDFTNFIPQSYRYGAGGGVLGALLAYPLYMFAGLWGGLLLVLLVVILCLLATGRAQRVFRWTMQRADESQQRREQRRSERSIEQTFDDDRYTRLRQPAPRQSARPSRPMRRAEPNRDYMVIDSPAPAPTNRRSPRTAPSASRKRIYSETVDPDSPQQAEPQFAGTDMEIPKSLRKIRESRAAGKAKRTAHPADAPR